MIEQFAEYREKEKVAEMFKPTDEYVALKCFVYLYTGNYAYKKIN